jgi:CubicO group peptidase (beta-lactamase class C family)
MFLAAEAVRSHLPGRPAWETICRNWLLDPIGARTMTFQAPTHGPIALTPQPDVLPWALSSLNFTHMGHPGGGIFGRLEDIIKVIQLHLNGGVWDGQVILGREQVAEMRRVRHRTEILEALAQDRTPDYEPYGVGWRIKLNQQDDGFGLGNRTLEGAFGHAGVGTVMSVGIPQKQLAIAFIITHPVATFEIQTRIRNEVTDRINDSIN